MIIPPYQDLEEIYFSGVGNGKYIKRKYIKMIELDNKRQYYGRLEDLIRIGKEGSRVDMEVELKKLPIIPDSHIKKEGGTHEQSKTHLLTAYFTFVTGDQLYRLSKVYMFATGEESLDSLRKNKEIANIRLKIDYDRLKAANIHFQEKYF